MDHIVYVDAKAQEMEGLLSGQKRMIIRGATGRKMPYGRVEAGDVLYFMNNNGEGLVKARALVTSVLNSEKLTPEASAALVAENQGKLQLTAAQTRRWAGKRYLVLIEVAEVAPLAPFAIDRSNYGNMDDWLPVEEIDRVRV